MSGFTIIAILVVLAAVAGFAFQKNGEFSGLGRVVKRGGLRHPHGKLVRTHRLDSCEDVRFLLKLGRVLAINLAVTALVLVVCAFGLLDLAGVLPFGIQALVVLGASSGLTQGNSGIWRALCYGIAGFALFSIASTLIAYALPATLFSVSLVNAFGMVGGAIGASVGTAAVPLMRNYAREFEDGHVNSILVASTSAAARAYDALEDASWKPPKDRVQDAEEADDIRSRMRKRSGEQ